MEPNIGDYAVRPPYLKAISDRAYGLSSFILFGDRGAGKSATRLTVYGEIWNGNSQSEPNGCKAPFVVNLTDFTGIQEVFKQGKLSDKSFVGLVAFAVIEQMLVWISSLEEEDRNDYIEALDKSERTLILALIRGFYLSVPEFDREISTSEALKLLNSAWMTKSAVWTSRRWDALSKIIAAAVNALSRKVVDESVDISEPAELILRSLVGESPNAPRAILGKLVEFCRAFGFEGVCVLVDKVDETLATSRSAEASASLIHPLLANIQLLEVAGFSWILFLWSNIRTHFDGKYSVRLDKIAHANITWNPASLREMLDKRISYFSDGKTSFSEIFSGELDANQVFSEIIGLSVHSPRELIKLMDMIFREHDARGEGAPDRLDRVSLDLGQDKYALETISSWYAVATLQQVLRVGKVSFINKDVQSTFKIGDQGARVKIKTWEDAGLVRQNGTAPSETGAKPSYLFVVADARVERIIQRNLDEVVGAEIEADVD
jgi:hypothetical protein